MRPNIGRSCTASSDPTAVASIACTIARGVTMTSIAAAVACVVVASTCAERSTVIATSAACLVSSGGVHARIEFVQQRGLVRSTPTVGVARTGAIRRSAWIVLCYGIVAIVGVGIVVRFSAKHVGWLQGR